MATASSYFDIKGHATASMVVMDIYPQIMREMICNSWSPKQVLMLIKNDQDKTCIKRLTPLEARMVSEMDNKGYNNLDLSCLYKVIRHCKLLPPPKQGWGQEPKPEDQSEGDDVERMKRIRNNIHHQPRGGLSESNKHDFFKLSFEIAKRMDIRIGSPQNGFESKIKDVQSSIVSQENLSRALEQCPEYQGKLQNASEAPCFNLFYGNDIKLKLDFRDETEAKGDCSSDCIFYVKDPNFDVNDFIDKVDILQERLHTQNYAISLESAKKGSLNLYVSIYNKCFMTKEILHKAIELFLYDIFRTAAIECNQGHTYTVVLATSTDLISDQISTQQDDVCYLEENPFPPVLKLNVKVKDFVFQNEFILYSEVNRFITEMYNAADSNTTALNGSSKDVYMLSDHEGTTNCTPSPAVIEDLRSAQEPVVSGIDSNYIKISTLLLRIAPRAVRIKFDELFSPEVLKEVLKSNLIKISNLKTCRSINQEQWNSMFPKTGDPVSHSFDTTLMICLLVNLKGINITNHLPHPTDYSVGADLSRIDIYRRDIANSNDETCDKDTFGAYWNEIEAAVLRLSDDILKGECCKLKARSYVIADRKTTLNNILAGKILAQIEVADRVDKNYKKPDCFVKVKEEWEKESKWFVPTKAFTFILAHKDKKILTVVGNPGMGKSMLLHQTALFLKDIEGYSVFSCRGPSDLISQFRKDTKQVFVLDDACGKYKLVQSKVDQWNQYETRIARILESTTVVILVSCRSDIFKDTQCQSLLIFSGCRCDLNDGECAIDKQEKLKMAIRSFSQKTISEVRSDLDSFNMLPLLCRLYLNRKTWNSVKFLYDPFRLYNDELQGFYDEVDKSKWCSLFLCVIHNGCINQAILMDESESDFSKTFKIIFAQFGLNADNSRQIVLESLDGLVNIYLKKRDNEFHVLHDELLGFLCYYFGKHQEQLMINYADSEIIRDRTLLQSFRSISQEFTIIIKNQNENDYLERLVKDMLSGNINDVLYNHQMIHKDFRSKLVSHLQKLDDEDLTVTNILSNFVWDENEKPFQIVPVNFACKYGFRELFDLFLSKTKDINAYEGNNIPLITACRKGDTYMTGLLLEKGADVNQIDVLGGSPLLWSCVRGNADIIKMILDKGADITYLDVCSKSSPLIWLCLGEFLYHYESAHIIESFQSTLSADESKPVEKINEHFFTQEHIIDMFFTVLRNGYLRGCIVAKEKYVLSKVQRIKNDIQNILKIISRETIEIDDDLKDKPYTTYNQTSTFIDIMSLFLDRGIDIDKSSIGGITALAFACMIDSTHSQSVRYLLSKGATVNKNDKGGTYPLHIAMRHGNEGLVKLLINNGANVNLPVDGISPIDWAISKQNMSIVDCLINAGANLDKRYENGATLLHFAIKSDNDELLKSLLRGGISVNCENYSGETPLMIAVNRCLVNVITILIKEGAEADICNSKGISSLMLASSKGDFDIVNMMFRNTQFTPNRTVDCLFSACRNSYLKLVGFLLDRGFDINLTEPNHGNTCLLEASRDGYSPTVALLLDKEANVNASNRARDTPLTVASMNGHTTIVRLLIAKKADMYRSNKKGECALIVACKNNHLEIVKVLIDNGCNIECTEKTKKQTCLSVASYHGYEKIVAFLIDHGADVNTKTDERDTPLKLASANNHFNIVKMLIEHKAYINFRDTEGSTPLSGAICSGNDNMVAYLIEHEANVNIKDSKGVTPLMLAASNGHYNIVKMLVESRADITLKNKEGFTCVSKASDHGKGKILEYFIEKGANVNIPNKEGNTPLMLAASKGHLHIVKMLLKHQAGVTIWEGKGLKNKLLFLIHERAINKANNTGDSSLMLASKNGHAPIVQMLLNNGANMYMKNKEGLSSFSLAQKNKRFKVMDILRQNEPYSYSFSDNSFLYLFLADLFIYILGLYFYEHV